MKVLNGQELADYVKERQAKQVRNLRQSYGVFPKLAIVRTTDNPVILTYVHKKQSYGADILITVEDHAARDEDQALEIITQLNGDDSVHGIIVQLPLREVGRTEQLVNAVASQKDVDGLGENAALDPATPMAINWLLNGYAVELAGKRIVIVGQGRLVGKPLARMWRNSGLDVTVVEQPTDELASILHNADIIVSATGSAGLVTSDMLRPGVVVVDAATAAEDGKIVGDVALEVRERHDLTITPVRGGVGPLTVCALFDNVIRAARATTAGQAPS